MADPAVDLLHKTNRELREQLEAEKRRVTSTQRDKVTEIRALKEQLVKEKRRELDDLKAKLKQAQAIEVKNLRANFAREKEAATRQARKQAEQDAQKTLAAEKRKHAAALQAARSAPSGTSPGDAQFNRLAQELASKTDDVDRLEARAKVMAEKDKAKSDLIYSLQKQFDEERKSPTSGAARSAKEMTAKARKRVLDLEGESQKMSASDQPVMMRRRSGTFDRASRRRSSMGGRESPSPAAHSSAPATPTGKASGAGGPMGAAEKELRAQVRRLEADLAQRDRDLLRHVQGSTGPSSGASPEKLKALTRQNAELITQVETSNAKCARYAKQVAQLEKDVASAKGAQAKAEAESKEAEKRVKRSSVRGSPAASGSIRRDTGKAKERALQQEVDGLHQKCNELQEKLKRSQSELHIARKQHKITEDKVKALTADRASLEQQLSMATEALPAAHHPATVRSAPASSSVGRRGSTQPAPKLVHGFNPGEVFQRWAPKMEEVVAKDKLQFRTLFHRFDKDQNGFLTRDEFAKAIKSLDLAITHEEMLALLAHIDADHNNEIDYHEFAKGLRHRHKGMDMLALNHSHHNAVDYQKVINLLREKVAQLEAENDALRKAMQSKEERLRSCLAKNSQSSANADLQTKLLKLAKLHKAKIAEVDAMKEKLQAVDKKLRAREKRAAAAPPPPAVRVVEDPRAAKASAEASEALRITQKEKMQLELLYADLLDRFQDATALNASLKSSADDASRSRAAISDDQLRDLRAQLADAQDKLAAEERGHGATRDALSKSRALLAELQDKYFGKSRNALELSEELAEAMAAAAAAKKELAWGKLNAANALALTAAEREQLLSEAKEPMIQHLRDDLAARDAELSELKDRLERLAARHKRLQEQAPDDAIAGLEAQIHALEGRLHDTQVQGQAGKALGKEAAEQDARLADLEAQLAKARSDNMLLDHQLSDGGAGAEGRDPNPLLRRIRALEDERTDLLDRIGKLKREGQGQARRVAELEGERDAEREIGLETAARLGEKIKGLQGSRPSSRDQDDLSRQAVRVRALQDDLEAANRALNEAHSAALDARGEAGRTRAALATTQSQLAELKRGPVEDEAGAYEAMVRANAALLEQAGELEARNDALEHLLADAAGLRDKLLAAEAKTERLSLLSAGEADERACLARAQKLAGTPAEPQILIATVKQLAKQLEGMKQAERGHLADISALQARVNEVREREAAEAGWLAGRKNANMQLAWEADKWLQQERRGDPPSKQFQALEKERDDLNDAVRKLKGHFDGMTAEATKLRKALRELDAQKAAVEAELSAAKARAAGQPLVERPSTAVALHRERALRKALERELAELGNVQRALFNAEHDLERYQREASIANGTTGAFGHVLDKAMQAKGTPQEATILRQTNAALVGQLEALQRRADHTSADGRTLAKQRIKELRSAAAREGTLDGQLAVAEDRIAFLERELAKAAGAQPVSQRAAVAEAEAQRLEAVADVLEREVLGLNKQLDSAESHNATVAAASSKVNATVGELQRANEALKRDRSARRRAGETQDEGEEKAAEELRSLRVENAAQGAELAVLRERDAKAAGLRNRLRAAEKRFGRALHGFQDISDGDDSVRAIDVIDGIKRDTDAQRTDRDRAEALGRAVSRLEDQLLTSAAALDGAHIEKAALQSELEEHKLNQGMELTRARAQNLDLLDRLDQQQAARSGPSDTSAEKAELQAMLNLVKGKLEDASHALQTANLDAQAQDTELEATSEQLKAAQDRVRELRGGQGTSAGGREDDDQLYRERVARGIAEARLRTANSKLADLAQAVAERDGLRDKVRRLERTSLSSAIDTSPAGVLREKNRALLHERDDLQQRCRALEDEVDESRQNLSELAGVAAAKIEAAEAQKDRALRAADTPRDRQIDELDTENRALRHDLADLRAAASRLQKGVIDREAATGGAQGELAALEKENTRLADRLKVAESRLRPEDRAKELIKQRGELDTKLARLTKENSELLAKVRAYEQDRAEAARLANELAAAKAQANRAERSALLGTAAAEERQDVHPELAALANKVRTLQDSLLDRDAKLAELRARLNKELGGKAELEGWLALEREMAADKLGRLAERHNAALADNPTAAAASAAGLKEAAALEKRLDVVHGENKGLVLRLRELEQEALAAGTAKGAAEARAAEVAREVAQLKARLQKHEALTSDEYHKAVAAERDDLFDRYTAALVDASAQNERGASLEEMLARCHDLEDRLLAEELRNARLQGSHASLGDVSEMLAEADRLRGTAEEATALRNVIARLKREVDGQDDAIELLETKLRRLRQEANDDLKDHGFAVADLEAELKVARDRCLRLEEQVASLQAHIAKLVDAGEDSIRVDEEAVNWKTHHRAQLEALEDELADLERANRRLERELEDLRGEGGAGGAPPDRAHEVLEQHAVDIEKRHSALKNARGVDEKLRAAYGEIEKLEGVQTELTVECERLGKRNEVLEERESTRGGLEAHLYNANKRNRRVSTTDQPGSPGSRPGSSTDFTRERALAGTVNEDLEDEIDRLRRQKRDLVDEYADEFGRSEGARIAAEQRSMRAERRIVMLESQRPEEKINDTLVAEGERDDAEHRNKKQQQELETLRKRLALLGGELPDDGADSDAEEGTVPEEEYAALQQRFMALEEELAQKQGAGETEKSKQLEGELAAAQEKIAQLEGEVGDLAAELKAARERIADLEARLAAAAAEAAADQGERAAPGADLAQVRALNQDLDAARDKAYKLQEELSAASTKLREAEVERAAGLARTEEAKLAQAKAEAAQATAEGRCAWLESELGDVHQRGVGNTDALREQVAKLESDTADRKNELAGLRRELAAKDNELAGAERDIASKNSQLASLKATLASEQTAKEVEVASLKRALANLEDSMARAPADRGERALPPGQGNGAEMAELRRGLDDLAVDNEKLKRQLANRNRELSTLEGDIRRLESERRRSSLIDTGEDARRQSADAQRQLLDANRQLSDLQRRLSDAQHSQARAENDNPRLQDEIARLKGDNARFRDDNARLKDDNERLKDENERLRRRVRELEDELARLKAAIARHLGVQPSEVTPRLIEQMEPMHRRASRGPVMTSDRGLPPPSDDSDIPMNGLDVLMQSGVRAVTPTSRHGAGNGIVSSGVPNGNSNSLSNGIVFDELEGGGSMAATRPTQMASRGLPPSNSSERLDRRPSAYSEDGSVRRLDTSILDQPVPASPMPFGTSSLGADPGAGRPKAYVAVYDYDPVTQSPYSNGSRASPGPRSLPLREGDVVVPTGRARPDGFMPAQVNGVAGLVPIDFLEEIDGPEQFGRSRLVNPLGGGRASRMDRSIHPSSQPTAIRRTPTVASPRRLNPQDYANQSDYHPGAGKTMVARLDYDPDEALPASIPPQDQLSFRKGDRLKVNTSEAYRPDGFVHAMADDGESGYIPLDFVEDLPEPPSSRTSTPGLGARPAPGSYQRRATPLRTPQQQPLRAPRVPAPSYPMDPVDDIQPVLRGNGSLREPAPAWEEPEYLGLSREAVDHAIGSSPAKARSRKWPFSRNTKKEKYVP